MEAVVVVVVDVVPLLNSIKVLLVRSKAMFSMAVDSFVVVDVEEFFD